MLIDPRHVAFRERFLPFICDIARFASVACRNRSFSETTKPDGSPVTTADLEASDRWCRFLNENFPLDGVVSEEAGLVQENQSGRTWFVDPIDGTKQFADGTSDFYILAGLVEKANPIFGIHINPLKNKLIAAGKHCGVWFFDLASGESHLLSRPASHGTLFHLKGVEPQKRAAFFSEHHFQKPPFPSPTVHMLCPLDQGYAGFASFRETSFWDLVAPAAIALEAGYVVQITSSTGKPGFDAPDYVCKSAYCLPPETAETLIPSLNLLK
jgi:3'-phosphoadenosine 5'-phosphosulfate (PAPS) 3'-phosphatase